jgi:hypothetical protein
MAATIHPQQIIGDEPDARHPKVVVAYVCNPTASATKVNIG